MNCPHCGAPDFEDRKGVELRTQKGQETESGSDLGDHTQKDPEETKSANVPLFDGNSKPRARGKALVYSGSFEVAWRAYGRKEEKLRAYKEWVVQAPTVGGENRLLQLILSTLNWQAPMYAAEGWKFAKYFERYLRARKWEDEPPPLAIRNGRSNGAPTKQEQNTAVALRFMERHKT